MSGIVSDLKADFIVLKSGVQYLNINSGENLVITTFSSDFSKLDKGHFLGLMMSPDQLNQILDNAHLFDSNLISASLRLKEFHDNLKIELT